MLNYDIQVSFKVSLFMAKVTQNAIMTASLVHVKPPGKVQLTVIIVAGIRENKFCYSVDNAVFKFSFCIVGFRKR